MLIGERQTDGRTDGRTSSSIKAPLPSDGLWNQSPDFESVCVWGGGVLHERPEAFRGCRTRELWGSLEAHSPDKIEFRDAVSRCSEGFLALFFAFFSSH